MELGKRFGSNVMTGLQLQMTAGEMVMYVVEDLSMRDQAWSPPFVYNNLLMKVEERQREKAYHCPGLLRTAGGLYVIGRTL